MNQSGTYFATYEQTKNLLELNKKLEVQLNILKSEEFKILPKNIPFKGIQDPFFGYDVHYSKLLTRNAQLKHEIDKLT